MPITRTGGTGVKAVMPLKKSTHGVSGSFMVQADDGLDYWCKAINNPASKRIPVNEQIAGRLGQMIGVATTKPELVDLSDIEGWEFHPNCNVEPGWAHGARPVEAAIEVRDLQHRSEDDNRKRHAGFYALMDWLAGGDQQWLYSGSQSYAYYSHDHGHFFPGGPDWTAAALSATGTTERSLGIPSTGVAKSELDRLAAEIESADKGEIEGVMSKIPPEWPVDDAELEALVKFLVDRQDPVAARLRALVT